MARGVALRLLRCYGLGMSSMRLEIDSQFGLSCLGLTSYLVTELRGHSRMKPTQVPNTSSATMLHSMPDTSRCWQLLLGVAGCCWVGRQLDTRQPADRFLSEPSRDSRMLQHEHLPQPAHEPEWDEAITLGISPAVTFITSGSRH